MEVIKNVAFHKCLGYQASLPSYNRTLVERSGVARALVEVGHFFYIFFYIYIKSAHVSLC